MINIFLLLLHLFLETQSANSSQPILARNYFLVSGNSLLHSGRKQVTITNYSSPNFDKRFYTSTFQNTLNTIIQVYYATTEMNAET